LARICDIFFDVDGKKGKDVIPFPHHPHYRQDLAAKYDNLSVTDRLDQLGNKLTKFERGCLEALALHATGGNMKNMGFFDLLRWWALSDYSYDGYVEKCGNYKFQYGQTSFARKFFEEAVNSGNLSYMFNCKAESIKDCGRYVELRSIQGETFRAKRIICTAPINVLSDMDFSPKLPALKLEAIKAGQICYAAKVHIETKGRELGSMTAFAHPGNELLYAWGTGTTPAGNTNIVTFGCHEVDFDPEADINKTLASAKALHKNMDIQRLVSLSAFPLFPVPRLTRYLGIP